MNNRLSGPFVLDLTDFNKIFHFCSLSVENRSLTLIGSTIQIRFVFFFNCHSNWIEWFSLISSLGSFFIIQQYSASSLPYTFCLQTLHLNDDEIFLTSSRQCQLSLDIPLDDDRLHLTSFDCPWRKAQDEYSTLIVPLWPAIFLEEIYNQSEARGRLFRKIDMTNIPKRVDRWHQFHLQVCLISKWQRNGIRYSIGCRTNIGSMFINGHRCSSWSNSFSLYPANNDLFRC